MKSFLELRHRMVDEQLKKRGLTDPLTLLAMESVAREEFVPSHLRDLSYEDGPLPIGEDQTISQPYVVAFMTQLAKLNKADRVLEIGTGSGYQAAILSCMVKEVYTVERLASLALAAQERFARLGYLNVFTKIADGTLGWKEKAPFDAILVTAGAPDVPSSLVDQLKKGGRMIIPVGPSALQVLICVTKDEQGEVHQEEIEAVRFVPLIGKEGW